MYSVDEPWCSSKLIACNATLYDRKTGDAYLEWFVGPTFGEDKSLSHFSTTKCILRDSSAHIRWLVIHSTGDRLVNLPQSEAILSHLSQLYGWQTTNFISKNFDELTGAHNDIITKANYIEIYTKIVRDFIVI